MATTHRLSRSFVRSSRFSSLPRRTWVAATVSLLACHAAHAAERIETITVSGWSDPAASVGNWGEVPISKAPFQASVTDTEALRDRGFDRIADLTRVDPAVSDAYNSVGYWDFLAVRGYLLDQRFNYRRDGLPISAETSIPLENKDRLEVLKGTSGLQAGTSAPGGLVNFVVKRPVEEALRNVRLAWTQPGSVLGAVDLNQRFGTGGAFGLRLNAAAEHIDPMLRHDRGERSLVALAGDWRIAAGTLLQAEVETSRRNQPSQPGFSLLGNAVPVLKDARINLNDQPWSQPVVMDGTTGSLRLSQKLADDWAFTAHAATQQLTSQDRLAYAFGCGAEGNYNRYCSDGTYDLYDFRSENEHRRTDALQLALNGALKTGSVGHAATFGVLKSRVKNRFQGQAYNYVGTGNVAGTLFTPADPSLTDENTNRDERSTEWFAQDAAQLTPRFTAWLGLRHSRIARASVRTDGSRPTGIAQTFNSPWVAASFALTPASMVYASWGRGVESEVAPNRARYANAGQALPALQSRQAEAGWKLQQGPLAAGLTLFDIHRPAFDDLPTALGASVSGPCDSDATAGSCRHQIDGESHHRGIEADLGWRDGPWTLRGGIQWLHARREGSANGAINGQRPSNVPERTLKLDAAYDLPAVPGLTLQAGLVAEGNRLIVLNDLTSHIGGYARIDAGLRYVTRAPFGTTAATATWRLGIDNALDRKAWRESPVQYDHAYLFPLAPRTLRASVDLAL